MGANGREAFFFAAGFFSGAESLGAGREGLVSTLDSTAVDRFATTGLAVDFREVDFFEVVFCGPRFGFLAARCRPPVFFSGEFL